ncbi:uncharacterized protein [Apostichopus japonicus]|uniref:uncharacterized protein n=1 Tax=Stichopus japonicus TaxID=307972 RepID=UPI003AB333CE
MARLEMTTAECKDVDLGAEVKLSAPSSQAPSGSTQYITFRNVDDGGILDQAGVRNGDILQRINGTQLKEVEITLLLEMIKQKPTLNLGLQRCSQFHTYTSIMIFLEPTIVDSCPTLKRLYLYWNVPAHERPSDFCNFDKTRFRYKRFEIVKVKGFYQGVEYWLTLQTNTDSNQVTFLSGGEGTLSHYLTIGNSILDSQREATLEPPGKTVTQGFSIVPVDKIKELTN